jgi:hypothetical protein
MKTEFIHVILGEVYFAIEERVIPFICLKRISFIPTCTCKLYVTLGLKFLEKENFRRKRRNL